MSTEASRKYQREWMRKKRRTYTTEQKERQKEVHRIWRQKNVAKWREYSWNWQGIPITAEQYDILLQNQKGSCAICGVSQNTLDKPLHVDHDHKTGKIRGLLCQKCNRGLGHFNDDLALMKQAMVYLKRGKP